MKTFFYLRIKGSEFHVTKTEFMDMIKFRKLEENGDGSQDGLWSRVTIFDGNLSVEVFLDCDKLIR